MAINYDGEYEVRLFYTTVVGTAELQHRHTIDIVPNEEVTPGESIAAISCENWDGSSQNLGVAMDTYIALLQPLFRTDTNFTHYELWKYPPDGFDSVFIGAEEIALAGTAAVATQPAQQYTLTFRSAGGSIMRVQLMETVIAADTFQAVPWSSAAANAIRTLLTGLTHPFAARDNTRPIAGIRYAVTQNEKLYRKRFRPA